MLNEKELCRIMFDTFYGLFTCNIYFNALEKKNDKMCMKVKMNERQNVFFLSNYNNDVFCCRRTSAVH